MAPARPSLVWRAWWGRAHYWPQVYHVYHVCNVYHVYLNHENHICHFVPSVPCAPSRASSASLILEALGCAQNWPQVYHFCPVFQVYQPCELNGASLIWEAWGRAQKLPEANVLSTPDLSRKPGKVWGWLLKSWENKQSYAERLFFQSRNFLANLFWHQIDPDTDSWHWNVGCNFHLETVGWLPARVSWVSWQLEGLLPLQRCTPSPLHPETILRYLRNKSSQVEWVQLQCVDYKGHLSTGRREYKCKKSKAFFLHFFVYLIRCKDFLYLYKKYKLKAQSVSTFTPSVHEVMQYLRKWPGKNINFALLTPGKIFRDWWSQISPLVGINNHCRPHIM